MSQNLPNIYGQQFAFNVQLLLQQKESRLRGLVTQGSYSGKQAQVVDQLGAINMQPVTGRFTPIGRVDAPVDSRWVSPADYDLNQLIDSFDKLKLLVDPASAYVQNAVAAANRQIDDIIIASLFAAAKTGETGTTSTAFPAGNIVAVNEGAASDTGLTVAKIRAGKKMLRANEVDFDADPITMIISAEQEDDLLNEIQVTSGDFSSKLVMMEGRIERFLGVNFIHSERLGLSTVGSHRRCPMFAKSGMHLGMWKDSVIDVSQRKDLTSHPWQAYLMLSAGATRLEEDKVIEILCDE